MKPRNGPSTNNVGPSLGLGPDRPMQVETFSSFPVNQVFKFDILLANHIEPNKLIVNILNPLLEPVDKQLDWIKGAHPSNGCRVSFKTPLVGIYTISAELVEQTQFSVQFQAKAYDLSKVFINDSSGRCFVNESYEFSVDASEAGEGQLEIAVNEGEIPNQVQVLDNGKCIVSFVPEDSSPHVVDIKFNGHDVNGCPFVVEVIDPNVQVDRPTQEKPATLCRASLSKEERILVNSKAEFSIANVNLDNLGIGDLLIVDPESQPINYKLIVDKNSSIYKFEFVPKRVGDYSVELSPESILHKKLPPEILNQFPFPLKVFDYSKVIISDVTDGVIGHPIYFFIDASQAGSGNLEIRVLSKTRTVPNHPQSEANAKIRVNFTPTEAVDHSIDVKFNGIPVPGNPFLVKVAQYPQARLPVTSQDLLKYIPVNETICFYVDYIGSKENRNMPAEDLTSESCQVHVLKPDSSFSRIASVELVPSDRNDRQMRFKVTFRGTKIGPYKLFITVNNELLPASPIVCNIYNINEVKVTFEPINGSTSLKPVGQLNRPVTFTVDASRAGEGTLALAVVSGISKSHVQTDVKVSDKGHGLYNLTFVPIEYAPHSIDMSFNDRVVPNSPFVVDIVDASGKSASVQQVLSGEDESSCVEHETKDVDQDHMVQDFAALNLKSTRSKSPNRSVASKKSLAFGLVNASNIVYLEPGLLENCKNQVSVVGPNDEKVPHSLAKGSPQPGEPKKLYVEYRPKSIGTHTINVLEGGKDLRQYFVEICDPSLIKVTGMKAANTFVVGKPIFLVVDSQDSGKIQLDSITVMGPKRSGGKVRDGDQTILGRLKSISSSNQNQTVPIEYSLNILSDHKQEIRFVPQVVGIYTVDIRCLGQSVGSAPFEIEVWNQSVQESPTSIGSNSTNKSKPILSKEEELFESIVVHGISLKCSPVNSTGAFIIETNRLAQARDFDVLITDPHNSLVDVQCYLQQDGNLLAEWTPRRVGK